ncbi:MAG: hypothetical protein K8S94_06550 [Planctomycetia bacterium]|nr:hypothetical protein [Planctomycetia bacterium]
MSDASDRRTGFRHRADTADSADEPRILPLAATQTSALRDVLESIVSEVRGRAEVPGTRVRVTLDVPAGQFVDADPALFRGALEGLMTAAFAAAVRPGAASDAPRVREVVVTSVDADDAFELEIADSGSRTAADAGSLSGVRALADRCGGEIVVAECPEGGTAVTIRLSRRRAMRKAA